jgi:large subunit ribosomal protein L17
MRHLRAGRKLSADTQHRLAMRRNVARSLFLRGRVTTTPAKAKAARPFVERLVTRAKRAVALKDREPSAYLHQVRVLARDIPDKAVLKLLIERIAPMVKDRPGGYTRILRHAKNQVGDNAPRALFEFVDRPPPSAEEGAAEEGAETGSEAGRKKKATKKSGKAAAAPA